MKDEKSQPIASRKLHVYIYVCVCVRVRVHVYVRFESNQEESLGGFSAFSFVSFSTRPALLFDGRKMDDFLANTIAAECTCARNARDPHNTRRK